MSDTDRPPPDDSPARVPDTISPPGHRRGMAHTWRGHGEIISETLPVDRLGQARSSVGVEAPLGCLCVLGSDPDQSMLLLDGTVQRVGRDPSNDLVIDDARCSRQHFDVGRDGDWWICDRGSANGTCVGGPDSPLPPDTRVPLADGSRILAGTVWLTFYAARGPHDHVLRHLITDPVSGLLNRAALLSEIARRRRRGIPSVLAAFDIDGYRQIRERFGAGDGMSTLRSFASSVTRHARASFGAGVLTGCFKSDSVGVLVGVGSVEGEWDATAAAVDAIRRGASADASGEYTVSAALVDVGARATVTAAGAEIVLTDATDKLLQAKLGGGARSATTHVQPHWYRHDEAAWRKRASTTKVVALGRPRGAAGAQGLTAILRSVAAALDVLAAETEVAVAWRPERGAVFLATDATPEALRNALDRVREMRFDFAAVGADLDAWLDRKLVERDASTAAVSDRSLHFGVAQLLLEHGSIPEYERLTFSAQALEAVVRLVGCTMVAGAAHDLGGDGPHAVPVQAIQGVPNSGADALWLEIVQGLAPVAAHRLPPATRTLLRKGFLDRARDVMARRPRMGARLPLEQIRGLASEFWSTAVALAETLREPEFRIVHVEHHENVRRKPGWCKVRMRSLGGLIPAEAEEHELRATLGEGLWLATNDEWIDLSPLLVHQRCHECGRSDLFAAVDLPRNGRDLERRGMVDLHAQREVVSLDERLDTVLRRLRSKEPSRERTIDESLGPRPAPEPLDNPLATQIHVPYAFLSHAGEDAAQVQQLCAFLEERRVRCWMAPRDVREGLYGEQLVRAIQKARAAVLLLSRSSNMSENVAAEMEQVHSNRKVLFVLRLEDVRPSDALAYYVDPHHWFDLFRSQRESVLQRFSEELVAVLRRPA